MAGCDLRVFPMAVVDIYGLKRLDLSHNYIGRVPAEFFQHPNMRYLDLAYNDICEIEPGIHIGNILTLETLILSGNHVEEIPHAILKSRWCLWRSAGWPPSKNLFWRTTLLEGRQRSCARRSTSRPSRPMSGLVLFGLEEKTRQCPAQCLSRLPCALLSSSISVLSPSKSDLSLSLEHAIFFIAS